MNCPRSLIALALTALALMAIVGCTDSEPGHSGQDLAVLARGADSFEQAQPGKVFEFPADHGAHEAYRIEWWYLTMNLKDEAGNDYGAQWTLFRTALNNEPADEAAVVSQNAWQSGQVYMAHFAVTTPGQHRSFQRYARGGRHGSTQQAGVRAAPFAAWLDDWRLASSGQAWLPLTATARQGDVAIDIRLDSQKSLVLQGEGGFSVKHPSGTGSYYYSLPWLTAGGTLEVDGVKIAVEGQAWLDREWSSQFLQPGQQGWDWMALHLEGGEKLMVFQLRGDAENLHSHGVLFSQTGTRQTLTGSQLSLSPLRHAIVNGRNLPLAWQVDIPALQRSYRVEAVLDDQWMEVDFPYWEGVVDVTDPAGLKKGVGYLEMTGYAKSE